MFLYSLQEVYANVTTAFAENKDIHVLMKYANAFLFPFVCLFLLGIIQGLYWTCGEVS